LGPLGQGLLDPSGIRVVGQLKQGLVSIAPCVLSDIKFLNRLLYVSYISFKTPNFANITQDNLILHIYSMYTYGIIVLTPLLNKLTYNYKKDSFLISKKL
jgi:hypothetical protein